jgi:signal peptidase I
LHIDELYSYVFNAFIYQKQYLCHSFFRIINGRPGDVVVFRSPQDPTKFHCKRIVAMPHSWVVNNSQNLWEELDSFTKIPEGHVWVQGDNQNNSNDSRSYGYIPMGLITGRVFLKFSPVCIQLLVSFNLFMCF